MALSRNDKMGEPVESERPRRGQASNLLSRLRDTGEHCASLPDHDTGAQDEIMGYDQNGLWT